MKQEEEPKKVLLVAGDVYRPAAIDQLIALGKRIEVIFPTCMLLFVRSFSIH